MRFSLSGTTPFDSVFSCCEETPRTRQLLEKRTLNWGLLTLSEVQSFLAMFKGTRHDTGEVAELSVL